MLREVPRLLEARCPPGEHDWERSEITMPYPAKGEAGKKLEYFRNVSTCKKCGLTNRSKGWIRRQKAPKNTGEMQEARYLYAPRYRPPSSFTLPKGDWDLVENPKMAPFPGRRDLPLSKHNFGVVSYDHELTPDEVKSYELDYLGGEMVEDGQSVEYKGWTITPWEGTQIGYGLPNSRNVGQQIGFHAHRKAKGYTLSHPDEGQGHQVRDEIAAAKKYIDDYGY